MQTSRRNGGDDKGVRPMGECVRGDSGRARWRGSEGPLCGRHFVTSPPIRRRATATAGVVGTILVAINQGDVLLTGDLDLVLLWKIPMTYAVPYLVTTWGAMSGGRLHEVD